MDGAVLPLMVTAIGPEAGLIPLVAGTSLLFLVMPSSVPAAFSAKTAVTGLVAMWFSVWSGQSAPEDEGDGLMFRPFDVDHQGAIGGKRVAF